MAQTAAEFEALLELLGKLKPRRILEIGVWQGGSLFRFAERFPQAIVVGIDPEPLLGFEQPANVRVITGRSQDPSVRAQALALLEDPPDFVHIDGDHAEAAVRADWTWSCEVAGYISTIALHDAATRGHPGIEVWKLWDELKADSSLDTVELFDRDEPLGYGVVRLP